METKDVVAILALIVSLIALFWQPLKHALDGARVRVRLLPGLWYPVNGTLSQAGSWASLAEWTAGRQGWTIEVAILEVENPGRIGLTIGRPSLDFGRTKRWRPGRASVMLRPLDAPGASMEPVHRLQPFDRVFYVFDFWPNLQPGRGVPRRPFKIRGSVAVAGKRRPSLSPRRRRWTVRPGAVSFFDSPPDAKTVAYRAIRRHAAVYNDDCILICCARAAHEIAESFPLSGAAPTTEQVHAILDRAHPAELDGTAGSERRLGRAGHPIISMYAAEDMAPHYAAPATPASQTGA